jgi:hypothetical protein
MTNAVKAFIEDNINLIDAGEFIAVYNKAYEDMYDNQFVRELTRVFQQAGLDVYEARENRLYNMLAAVCGIALMGGENNLHRLLDNENNWYGYDIYNVIDFFEQMQYNLGVKLVPIDDYVFKAPNYFIVENDV